MVVIVIAGMVNDIKMVEAEMAGYYMQQNLPDFAVKVIMVASDEWTSFVEEKHKASHWDIRVARDQTLKPTKDLNQMIYYESGELIGRVWGVSY